MKEKEAIAKAKIIADAGLLSDAAAIFKATLDESTGFLKAPVTLARTGVQYYMGYELGMADRALEKIGVFRPGAEVFHDDAIYSFENMVVTDDHPSEAVTVDNVKTLQMGQVSNIAFDDKVVRGMVTITDANLIKKIQSGKVEVSVGYSHDLEKRSGVYQGDKYEYAQVNIRGNHLAVVDAGRCGAACKLTIDLKGGNPMKITLDGSKFEVADEQLAQAILDTQASHVAQLKAKDEEMSKAEEEKEKAIKEKDEAEAEKEAMKSEVPSKDSIDKMVASRAKVLAKAGAILGDKMPDCGCGKKAMAAVVDHIFPDMSLDGKSDDYVAAAYDMAVAKFEKAEGSLDNLKDDFSNDGKSVVSRDSARNKYMTDQLGLEV